MKTNTRGPVIVGSGNNGLPDEKPTMHEDTEFHYWQMLMAIESGVDPKKDILDKIMVEGAYAHWNRCHPDKEPKKPRWVD